MMYNVQGVAAGRFKCCVGSHVATGRDVGGMAVAHVPSSKWRVSQGYAQVVNSGWKLKCMYWRGRRFDVLTSDGLVGATRGAVNKSLD